MRVLVTGGAGYIGSVTAKALLDAGHAVVVYDDLSHGHRAAVDARAGLVVGSLHDLDLLTRVFTSQPFDAVVHFAALIEVGQSMAEPGLYFTNNVAGTISLLNAAIRGGVRRLVFSSTAAVYGTPVYTPIDEQHPLVPINVYGQGKLIVEQMLAWYGSQCGLRSVALRYFNASGAIETLGEDHHPESHLIPNLLAVPLGRRDHVDIYGEDYDTFDGTCVRDYVHVADLAEAHLLALARTEGASGVYNLGTGNGYSVRQVLDAARRVTGHPIPAEVLPRRAGDPSVLVASSELAERELGWQPKRNAIETIVRDAWRWHSTHRQGYDSSTTAS
jgi:UDP-glucose 4-epimerase